MPKNSKKNWKKCVTLLKMASVKIKGSAKMAVIVYVDGKNFNNNLGEFCADS